MRVTIIVHQLYVNTLLLKGGRLPVVMRSTMSVCRETVVSGKAGRQCVLREIHHMCSTVGNREWRVAKKYDPKEIHGTGRSVLFATLL